MSEFEENSRANAEFKFKWSYLYKTVVNAITQLILLLGDVFSIYLNVVICKGRILCCMLKQASMNDLWVKLVYLSSVVHGVI